MEYLRTATAVRDILLQVREGESLSDILRLILGRVCELSGALHGCLGAYDSATNQYIIVTTHGPDWTEEKKKARFSPGEGIIGLVGEKGQPFLSHDLTHENGFMPIFEHSRSVMAIPIVVGGKTWGVMQIDALQPHHFTEEALANAHLLAELAASAVTSRLENKLENRERDGADSSAHSLREMAAGVAHELNNPLTSILFHTSLLALKRGGPADDASIRTIVESAQRAADLVRNLRTLSAELATETEILGLNEIITQAVTLKKIQLSNSSTVFNVLTDPFSLQVQVNGPELLQALLVLLDNAADAVQWTRPNGVVEIKVARDKETALVEISDNGPGIPAEIQQTIFDPFTSTKGVGQGTGLGLARAHAAIKSFGGKLSLLKSGPGGSAFLIELPMALKASTSFLLAATPRKKLSVKKPLRGLVLLVDDEVGILDPLADYLAMKNITVRKAGGGVEALAFLQKEKFDAIVSDIRMPEINGLELHARAQKIDPRYKNNFVFITGDLVRGTNREQVNTTGCVCLEKPFKLDDLYDSLVPFLQKVP